MMCVGVGLMGIIRSTIPTQRYLKVFFGLGNRKGRCRGGRDVGQGERVVEGMILNTKR